MNNINLKSKTRNIIILIALSLAGVCDSGPVVDTPAVKKLYKNIEEVRNKNNLPLVVRDSSLAKAARDYAFLLEKHRRFTHTLFKTTPFQRVKDIDKSFTQVGEILALNIASDKVIQAWLDSPGHKKILLNNSMRKVGAYVTENKEYMVYVVVFGDRN